MSKPPFEIIKETDTAEVKCLKRQVMRQAWIIDRLTAVLQPPPAPPVLEGCCGQEQEGKSERNQGSG